MLALPQNWNRPSIFSPEAGLETGDELQWYPSRDSLTVSVGYNYSLSGAGCGGPLSENIYVGVRCNWGVSTLPCRLQIQAAAYTP